MNKRFVILGLLLILIGVGFVSGAIPNWQDTYVNDFAGIFNENQTTSLRTTLAGIDTDTTAEIVVVTDNECASKGGPSQYATELLSGWGVGKAEKDNGLLILYCKEENKIFVATGYGLEGILPDSKIGRLLDENYVTLRDSGDVRGGIISFVGVISSVIEENKEEVIAGTAGRSKGVDYVWIIFLIIWLLFIFRAIFRRRIKCKKDGLRMERIGRKGNRYIYKCLNGHIQEVAIAAATGFWIGHAIGGAHGGGFGGGGFGGGMGGGGGAGR